MSIRVPNKPQIEVSDVRYISPSGIKTVISKYYVTAKHKAVLIWEALKGWIFTKEGYTIKTSDDFYIKTKDQ